MLNMFPFSVGSMLFTFSTVFCSYQSQYKDLSEYVTFIFPSFPLAKLKRLLTFSINVLCLAKLSLCAFFRVLCLSSSHSMLFSTDTNFIFFFQGSTLSFLIAWSLYQMHFILSSVFYKKYQKFFLYYYMHFIIALLFLSLPVSSNRSKDPFLLDTLQGIQAARPRRLLTPIRTSKTKKEKIKNC